MKRRFKTSGTAEGRSCEDRALDRFTDLMIEKIKTLQENWQKPWFTEGVIAWPKNLSLKKLAFESNKCKKSGDIAKYPLIFFVVISNVCIFAIDI